jgi:hypothetical protein
MKSLQVDSAFPAYTPGKSELLARLEERLSSYSWRSVVWAVNAVFIAVTVIYHYLPDNRKGVMKLVALFSLQFEKNLATYWEGWCLLIIAILAFQRFLNLETSMKYERRAWIGFGVLVAGLSLDELGSIHERSEFLFTSFDLSGMRATIPLAVPVVFVLIFTLLNMFRLPDRRSLWLTIAALGLFGAVVLQEHLEQSVAWPFWAGGIRCGFEEGTELAGIFLLLTTVLAAGRVAETDGSAMQMFPSSSTLVRMKPVFVFLTLLSFIPLAILTVVTIPVTENRGIPAAWLPFVLLSLSCMVAWNCARRFHVYRGRFLVVSAIALFFSLDQIIVFQRVVNLELTRGEVEKLMIWCLAAACLTIPLLRTKDNMIVMSGLLLLSGALIPTSELLPRLIIPLQSLGIYCVLAACLKLELEQQFTS